MLFPQRHCGFVLSAGRTGTVFLSRNLTARFADVAAVHEPSPARWEHVLGNLRNRTGLGRRTVRWIFLKSRRRRLKHLPHDARYVEINPLLCPITDLLPLLPGPLRVVHLVRHAETWADSILQFRASGPFRHVIEHIPFALPYPVPRPPGWRDFRRGERALWRWRYCNEQILALVPHCARYAVIRYEDLFHVDRGVRGPALRSLLETLEIPCDDDLAWFDIGERVNPAPSLGRKRTRIPPADVRAICGPLLERFGYSPTGE